MAPYPGREDHIDLGDGHSYSWIVDHETGDKIGLMEHHPPRPDARPGEVYCGGYVAWEARNGLTAKHELVSEDPVTISPSLQCRRCPSHGFIREGRWVPA